MPHTPLRLAFRRPWPGTRRGLKLWFISLIIGVKGMGYLVGQQPPSTDSSLRLLTMGVRIHGVHLYVPLQLCGAWIVFICCVAAFCSYCHFGRDRYGYMLLMGFCAGWATCYLLAPLTLGGPTYALQGATSWLLILALLAFCAGDPEPRSARLVL